MLAGLRAMDTEALRAACSLAELHPPSGASAAQMQELLLDWMARVLGLSSSEPEAVEAAALKWVASRWQIEVPPDEPNASLQARLWGHVSQAVLKNLLPVWKVGACMAALGPPGALPVEVEFLSHTARRMLLSDQAYEAMQVEWSAFCQPVLHHSQLLDQLQPELALLARQPMLVRPTLALTLVVALADSKFELEESRLYQALARSLGLDKMAADDLQERVSRVYWDAVTELSPPRRYRAEDREETCLRAAFRTLEQTGILEALQTEIQSGYLAGLHRTIYQDPDFQRGLKAWNRTPFLWPVGLAAGLCLYLRNRLQAGPQRNLARLIYLCWTRERLG